MDSHVIFYKVSTAILIIGLVIISIGGVATPQSVSSIDMIISGFSMVGAGILFILCINFHNSTIFSNGGSEHTNVIMRFLSQLMTFITRSSPYLATIGIVTWLIFMFSNNRDILSDNNVAPIFYTYFFVSYLCILIESIGIMRLTPDNIKPLQSSYLWNVILLFITLNIFSNITMQIILTNYVTQG